MENQGKYIELYPGNWLYNAGVIGFLQSLEMVEKENVKNLFEIKKDGRVRLNLLIFEKLNINKRYFDTDKIQSIYEKSTYFKNYLKTIEKEIFPEYVECLSKITIGKESCSICGNKYQLKSNDKSELIEKGFGCFFTVNESFNLSYYSALGPSQRQFPNAFWANQYTGRVCPICSFILIHNQLPQITLTDGTKLFINTPSFYLTYELNKILHEIFDRENPEFKNLLAMSLIEFTIRTKIILNLWASMDIELVATQKNGTIEFISLPYETVQIISNKRVAELLSSIGEFKILNMVIDGRGKDLVELGYRVLKIAMKPSMGTEDRNFINNCFYRRENQDDRNLKLLSNKLMKLYALIEERTKFKQYEYNY